MNSVEWCISSNQHLQEWRWRCRGTREPGKVPPHSSGEHDKVPPASTRPKHELVKPQRRGIANVDRNRAADWLKAHDHSANQ